MRAVAGLFDVVRSLKDKPTRNGWRGWPSGVDLASSPTEDEQWEDWDHVCMGVPGPKIGSCRV